MAPQSTARVTRGLSGWIRSSLPDVVIDPPDEERGRRDRVVDATMYLVAFAISVATLVDTWELHPPWLRPVAVVGVIATVGALRWRRRIAREMHDVLAHRLSLLSVHAGALEFNSDASAEDVAEAADVIGASARAALVELRGVIGVLREDVDESLTGPPQPTLADLPALVEESRAAGMRITARIELGDAAPAAAVGRTAYRIAQEGLTNARKHAPGAAVTLTVDAPDGDLQVQVRSLARVGVGSGPPAEIVRAIELVHAGDGMISPSVTRRLISMVAGDSDAGARTEHARDRLARLSPRERDVALAVGRGQANAEIAATLHLSVATVKGHVSRLLDKLGVDNRVQIALLVQEAGGHYRRVT